jgi:hypothetical protein
MLEARWKQVGFYVGGVYDFLDLIFNFLQKTFCNFLKKKDFISYTNVFNKTSPRHSDPV